MGGLPEETVRSIEELGIIKSMESISDYQKEVFTLLGRHLVMWLYKLDHYIQVIKHFSEVDLSRYIVFSFKTFTIHISCPLKRLKDELLFN